MSQAMLSCSGAVRRAAKAVGDRHFTWATPMAADLVRHDPEQVFLAGVRHHHLANTAYPIGHVHTLKPYRVTRTRSQKEIARVVRGAYGGLEELMLYAHVPFCPVRCQFCEYTVVDPRIGQREEAQVAYFEALLKEIELYSEVLGGTMGKKVVGFDIGGGTPSMARSKEIGRVLEAVNRLYSLDPSTMEISIETTPKIAAAELSKLKDYFAMGIRRISMGLQTTDFEQAQQLGRDDANAGKEYVRRAVENVRAAGFSSFNIDLMYGFPLKKSAQRRGVDPWAQTVKDCMALGPEHITLYRMRYKGTKMEHLQDRVGLEQVNSQAALAHELLTCGGYAGMVGKNTFSRVKGNTGCSDYLDRRVREAVPYIGFGLGAQSFSHHSLAYNLGAVTKTMSQYLRSVDLGRLPIQDLYHLPREASIGKMASVSFYYGGIDLGAFKNCFGAELEEVFSAAVPFLLEHGLMHYTDEAGREPGIARLQLTADGKSNFGGCVAQFYSPAVQGYLLQLPGGEAFAPNSLANLAAASWQSRAERTKERSGATLSPETPVADARKKCPAGMPAAPVLSTVRFTFVGGGEEREVEAPLGVSLLEVARANGVDIQAACQGECACSTCHVLLSDDSAGAVSQPSEEEQDMLELAIGNQDTSRLSCKVLVEESLRGARIGIPDDVLTARAGLGKALQAGLEKADGIQADFLGGALAPGQLPQAKPSLQLGKASHLNWLGRIALRRKSEMTIIESRP